MVDIVIENNKVIISCSIHGHFEKSIVNYKKRKGCPKCNRSNNINNTNSKNNFVNNISLKYSNIRLVGDYINSNSDTEFKCSIHGIFIDKGKYVIKRGCKECSKLESKYNLKKSIEDRFNNFITKAKSKHGDKYNYSKSEYSNAFSHITIICKEHGEFKQTPNNHLKYCCSKCSKLNYNTKTLYERISNFEKKFKSLYSKSEIKLIDIKNNYINDSTKV